MVYTVDNQSSTVLTKISRATRVGQLELKFSGGISDGTDRKKGLLIDKAQRPESWSEAVIQGAHIAVATPFSKEFPETGPINSGTKPIDLEGIDAGFIPRTGSQWFRATDNESGQYIPWGEEAEELRTHYRLLWRKMVDPGMVRTLNSAIIPPGATHFGAFTLGGGSLRDLVLTAASWSSILVDFSVKTSNIANLNLGFVSQLLGDNSSVLAEELILRTLRLNCLSDAYADLWERMYDPSFCQQAWALPTSTNDLGEVGEEWDYNSPLRKALDRRNALVEIDAIVAVRLGVTAEELCAVYRTQFPTLRNNDRDELFDGKGRKVPNEIGKLYSHRRETLSIEERTATNSYGNTYAYEYPFIGLDREADMRQAHAYFSKLMKEKS
jgi:hypothetical protein